MLFLSPPLTSQIFLLLSYLVILLDDLLSPRLVKAAGITGGARSRSSRSARLVLRFWFVSTLTIELFLFEPMSCAFEPLRPCLSKGKTQSQTMQNLANTNRVTEPCALWLWSSFHWIVKVQCTDFMGLVHFSFEVNMERQSMKCNVCKDADSTEFSLLRLWSVLKCFLSF